MDKEEFSRNVWFTLNPFNEWIVRDILESLVMNDLDRLAHLRIVYKKAKDAYAKRMDEFSKDPTNLQCEKDPNMHQCTEEEIAKEKLLMEKGNLL